MKTLGFNSGVRYKTNRWERCVAMKLTSAVTLALFFVPTGFAAAENAPSKATTGPEFPSVALALKELRAKNGVNISVQSGWTMIEDRTSLNFWSFTPANHPAYPAAVHRWFIQENGAWFVRMRVLCEAPKSACNTLSAEFETLNQKMREDLMRKRAR